MSGVLDYLVQLHGIGWLETIKCSQYVRLRYGVIPVKAHNVWCYLRTWELLFVGALLLSYKCAEMLDEIIKHFL